MGTILIALATVPPAVSIFLISPFAQHVLDADKRRALLVNVGRLWATRRELRAERDVGQAPTPTEVPAPPVYRRAGGAELVPVYTRPAVPGPGRPGT